MLLFLSNNLLWISDGTGKSHGKDLKSKDTGTGTEDSGVLDLKTLDDNANFSTSQGNASAHHSEKKRQKLHWGYVLLLVPGVILNYALRTRSSG